MNWRNEPRPWSREAWEDWAAELIDTRDADQLVQAIADMGEQVEILHATRLAAFGGRFAVPLVIPTSQNSPEGER